MTTTHTTLPSQSDIANTFSDYRRQLAGYGEFIEWAEALLRDADYDEQVGRGFDNWNTDDRYGATVIRDDYFEDYARRLADDLGCIADDVSWPSCHIDWEAAAESLQQDYTSFTFGGYDWWVR